MLISITVSSDRLRGRRPSRAIIEEVKLRPLLVGEKIEFGDYVQTEPFPDFEAGRVVHGLKVLPSEAVAHKFWRELEKK